jgi:hypothetical protein
LASSNAVIDRRDRVRICCKIAAPRRDRPRSWPSATGHWGMAFKEGFLPARCEYSVNSFAEVGHPQTEQMARHQFPGQMDTDLVENT